jgi:serine/threonine protein kinase
LTHIDRCGGCRAVVAEIARATLSSREGGEGSGARTLVDGDRLLERYEILRFVTHGGMGEIYEARDLLLDETVALKTIRSTALDDHRAAFPFKAEARLARRVSHPNVCRILEFGLHHRSCRSGVEETIPFFTMELLTGETLRRHIARLGPFGDAASVSMIRQIVAGLKAIHGAGVVHRDLKTENIFVVPDARNGERAVIMDFGLARAVDGSIVSTSPSVRMLSGSAHSMAPEQREGRPVTVAADVYALGILVYEMVTGKRPTAAATPFRDLREPLAPPSAVSPSLHRWDAFLGRCLESDPALRYRSLEELEAALPGAESKRRWRFWT